MFICVISCNWRQTVSVTLSSLVLTISKFQRLIPLTALYLSKTIALTILIIYLLYVSCNTYWHTIWPVHNNLSKHVSIDSTRQIISYRFTKFLWYSFHTTLQFRRAWILQTSRMENMRNNDDEVVLYHVVYATNTHFCYGCRIWQEWNIGKQIRYWFHAKHMHIYSRWLYIHHSHIRISYIWITFFSSKYW